MSQEITQAPAHRIIPQDTAREFGVIGLRFQEDGSLLIGLKNSISDQQSKSILDSLSKSIGIDLEAISVEDEEIERAIFNAFSEISAETIAITGADRRNPEGPVTELATKIITNSIKLRASDIHIEPAASSLNIRIRVDGKLENLVELPMEYSTSIISRLKVLAKMNIVEKRRPQDGQFSLQFENEDIDIRIATIATFYGEKAVLRILEKNRDTGTLEALGMGEKKIEDFYAMIKSHDGLVIAAGPTGSGKTTTMHCAIKILNTPEKNISTLEDPLEYLVPGVNHAQVEDAINAGFAVMLRGLLRQDPDVIMVGEMRDPETAKISVQGALAGRMLLSTLHATDAVGVISRLFQMDIEPHQLAASLKGIIAQRLIRRNCDACSVEYAAQASEKLFLKSNTSQRLTLIKGLGCTLCRGSGFKGRIGVFQILKISNDMRELISSRPSPTQLYAQAKLEKLRTLQEEALDLVLQGYTTVQEVVGGIGEEL